MGETENHKVGKKNCKAVIFYFLRFKRQQAIPMQKALDTLLMIRFASDYRQRLNELRQIITTRYWLLTSCPAGKQELAKKGGKQQHKSKW